MKRLLSAFCALLMMIQGWRHVPGVDAATPYLTFSTLGGSTGQPVRAVGTGLPAMTSVQLIWFRGAPSWQVKDGLFKGIKSGDKPIQIAEGTTDAQGKVTIPFTVPSDFGYIHNVALEAGGKALVRQGFTVVPTLKITPTSGPVGTPITVTFSGVGYSLYESVWHLLYDNARVGWMSAITTNGTATAVIPATGAVGVHTLQVISGTHPVPYLNQQQAPIYQPLIPTVLGTSFQITAGTPILPADPATQSLSRTAGATPTDSSEPHLTLDELSGTVGTSVTVHGAGFTPSTAVQLSWSTMVGNRISGSGFASQDRPLTKLKTDLSGAFSYVMATPDDLGGAHMLTASMGSIKAQAQYTITPSVFPISPQVVAPGEQMTIHLKGVGWTQTANIYTLVMDNNYVGYACGFNSQGDVTIHILAPGGSGIHYVDLYPAIYQGQLFGKPTAQTSVGGNVSYFQIPMLNAIDHPGERLPAFHLSFQVEGS